MAGDDLKKVQRGQALRIPASAYNAFIDAAADYRRRTLGIEGQYKQRDSRSGVVIVRNQSGAALDQFAVVELGSVIIGPSDNEQEFRSRTTFDVTTPAEEPGPMAILQEPIAAGGTGRAMLFGVTPVRLDVTDEEHEYAEVTPSEPGYLTSAATGAARVLYKDSGTGEVWAVVYFPASSPGGPLRLSGLDPERADGEPLTQCDDGAAPEPNEVPLNEALRIIEVEEDQFRLALNLETLYVVDPVTGEFEPLSDILRFPHLPAATQVIGDETEGIEAADPTGFAIGTDDKGLELWQQTRMGYFHEGDHKLYMYVRKALFDERGCLHSITGETRVEIDAPAECEGGGGGTGDMFKSVYDTDNNGLVDGAETLDDGVDHVSAGEVRTHIDDEAKHREINDDGTGLTDLWSASKITDELAGKADTDHAHVAADVTDFDTEVGNHPDVAANTAARHARQHGLNTSADHSGIAGTPNNFMALDAVGLPKDSGTNATDFADAAHTHAAAQVTDFDTEVENNTQVAANSAARHARQHGLSSLTDHNGITGTPNNLMGIDANGLPKDSGSKAADFAAAAHTHAAAQVTDFDTEVENNTQVAANSAARHARQHGVSSLTDHNGITGTPNNLMGIDANGLPKDSGSKAADFAAAAHTHVAAQVTDFDTEVENNIEVAANSAARHAQKHGLNSLADHNGITGTPDNLMGIDANGLPKDSGMKAGDFAEADHGHLAEDVADFDAEVGNHPDVAANTDARHKVKASAGDATPGYLSDKVVGAAGSVIVDNNKVQLEGDGIPYYPAYYGTQDDTGAKTWYPLPYQVRADIGGEPDYLDGLVQKSIVENATDHKIELDGDAAAPGANKVYGTDGGGNKGWQDAGGGGTVRVSANDTTPGYLLGKLVGDTNWLVTEEVNNGGDEDLKLKHLGPHAPTAVQTIGAAAEGNETAEGSSFVVGTGGNGLDFWVVSRIGYFHAGGRKLYMYVRKLTVDETGHVRAISGETRVEVDACVVETV